MSKIISSWPLTFAKELSKYMNDRLADVARTFVYSDFEGERQNLHWLVHMHNPADYGKLLEMADHDKDFQSIYQDNRLPQRGGGNWEKMFVQSSFYETILVPQHGFATEHMEVLSPRSFTPPARHQISGNGPERLHSCNAECTIIRSFNANYEVRDVARYYLSEWMKIVNSKGDGKFSAGQYEEMWGFQDRLHLKIHCKVDDDLRHFLAWEKTDQQLLELQERYWVEHNGTKVKWEGMFVEGSLEDTYLRLCLN